MLVVFLEIAVVAHVYKSPGTTNTAARGSGCDDRESYPLGFMFVGYKAYDPTLRILDGAEPTNVRDIGRRHDYPSPQPQGLSVLWHQHRAQ